jgi:hypothetical protein
MDSPDAGEPFSNLFRSFRITFDLIELEAGSPWDCVNQPRTGRTHQPIPSWT